MTSSGSPRDSQFKANNNISSSNDYSHQGGSTENGLFATLAAGLRPGQLNLNNRSVTESVLTFTSSKITELGDGDVDVDVDGERDDRTAVAAGGSSDVSGDDIMDIDVPRN